MVRSRMTMIDGRKTQKDLLSVARETYKEFAENTSIHGLKYSVKSDIALFEKIFWILIVVSGLLGAGYMTILFWNRFTSNPTRTSIMTDYAPSTTLPFPAITLCNLNRVIHHKVEQFMKKLDCSNAERDVLHRAFPQLLAFTNPSAIKYNTTELTILQDILLKNDFYDMTLIMKKISQSCAEMLIKCQWELQVKPCTEIFEESLTTDGLCCSFNYRIKKGKEPIRNFFSGIQSGLTLLIDPMVEEVHYSSLHTSGLKVILHSPSDYPGAGSTSKIISGGRLTFMQLMGTKIICSSDIQRLSMEQRQCCYPEERLLKYFPTYQDTNCLSECTAIYLHKKCNCVPFYFPFTDKIICNITSIACLDEAKKREKNLNMCNCPSQCEDDFFDVLSTTTKLHYNESKTDLSSFLHNESLTPDSILLWIYFSSDQQKVLLRDTITSTIYLLSSFGGVYSLFLGCSFITIVEILYYASARFLVNLKLLGRVERDRPVRNRENFRKFDGKRKHGNIYSREGFNPQRNARKWNFNDQVFLN